tara:strand:+ start:799 stop:1026 length:228 start_codon:yes stop_codon:yes gene_type:complete
MKKKDLINIIKKYLNKKHHSNINKVEWDSLVHLNILMELEGKSSSKVSDIKKITEANSLNKLTKLLSKNRIIKND